jgi:putative copper export protein
MIGLLLALTGLLAFAWKKPQQKGEKWARRIAFVLPFVIIAVPLSLLVVNASLIAIAALLATLAYWFYNFVGFNLP